MQRICAQGMRVVNNHLASLWPRWSCQAQKWTGFCPASHMVAEPEVVVCSRPKRWVEQTVVVQDGMSMLLAAFVRRKRDGMYPPHAVDVHYNMKNAC